jgi:Tol biopolymer transport system component/predicted Ser/Thr protein kinase
MTPERWRRIEELYHSAQACPPGERAAFLEAACGADAALRREIELLLAQDAPGDRILDRPAVALLDNSIAGPLAAKAELGPYRIEGLLGKGGMGTVYKAHDSRLGRTVAIKVSPAEFSGRFAREARAIAALNHPHICALYDVGPNYLVMEYVEGRPLHGPMPLEEALPLALQLLDALDAAHRKGIVHRDLKPANILMTKTGVKVLDFGLAKMERAVAAGEETVTDQGSIVGTLHYMSPEQVQGKEIDARSDIFSFGLVLYEMLTGRRAFEAENSASVMAAILEREPKLEEIGPAGFQRVLRRCLAKEPGNRWQSAADVKAALELTAEAAPRPHPRRTFAAGWLAAAVLAAAAAVMLFGRLRERPPEQRVVRMEIRPPGDNRLYLYNPPVLSPDGTRIVFKGGNRGALYVRSLDSLTAQELPGTENAGKPPFWSPDGRYLGFFAGGKLQKVSVTGGAPVTLCDVAGAEGGTWNRDGVIVFAPGLNSPLMRIADTGGPAVPVTRLDAAKGEAGHRWPFFLPDGKHFLFTVHASESANSGIFVGSLDSRGVMRLLPEESNAQYAEPGFILFGRADTLVAQPFDARRLRFVGDQISVAEGLSVDLSGVSGTSADAGDFAVFSACAGVLAYRTGESADTRLRWFDQKGHALGDVGPAGEYLEPALSPDGHAVAVSKRTAGKWDVWVIDLLRGTNSRLTLGAGDHLYPRWSPDGRQIAFSFRNESRMVVHRVPADGGGKEELMAQLDHNANIGHWTADGRYLIIANEEPGKPDEIWAAPLSGGKPFPVVTGSFEHNGGRVSPDGKWIAYYGAETGRLEIYIQDFPPTRGKWQISTGGGQQVRWRADGRELFYREGSKVMSVEVKTNGGKLEAGIPKALFDAPSSYWFFNVSADGQRFLLQVPDETQPFTVVLNWPAAIKRAGR